jgi:quercetin dioxygenase-like cupin family protein
MRLALLEDRLEEGERLSLDAVPRVVYVVSGRVEFESVAFGDDQAWYDPDAYAIEAASPARLWRWELRSDATASDPRRTTLKLDLPVELPAREILLRCDRVDFPPGGVAYTHTHQGPGIRVLLRGRFRVETDGRVITLAPGEPWFERGPDPVYAEAVGDEPASFVRVMVLPAALRGASSIRYVTPEDQARPKSQTYTVFVDAPVKA